MAIIYCVTHGMGADRDLTSIALRVNALTAFNGDYFHREKVLDMLTDHITRDEQAIFEFEIVPVDVYEIKPPQN